MAIENVILSGLVYNEPYLRKVIPYLSEEYFTDSAERTVFELIREYVTKYNVCPTKEALALMLNDMPLGEKIFTNSLQVLTELSDEGNNLEWMVDSTEAWCRDSAIRNAVQSSIEIINGDDKERDKNIIPQLLSEALAVSFDVHLGISYFDKAEEQYDYMHSDVTKFPFDVEILNRVTKGGIPRNQGTLNLFMMPINGGKTVCLINQAATWLAGGRNVVYFTMEVAEQVIRERTDARMFGVTFDQLHALQKTQYVNRIHALRKVTDGELIIKEFPPSSVHIGHFRHFLKELKIKKNFVPDVIIVDQLTNCLSSRLKSDMKGNSNLFYTAVAEELRSLGMEFRCPVWSVLQYGRAGQTNDDVDITDTALSIGIQGVSDFTLAGMIPEELIKQNRSLWKVVKNRYNNRNKLSKFVMGLDYDKQLIFDVDMSEQAAIMSEEDMELLGAQSTPKIGHGSSVADWKFN